MLLSVISGITVGDVSTTSDIWSFTTEGNYIGYLTLTTQAEMDALTFIEVKGTLIIGGNSTTSTARKNLNGLNNLTSIDGFLKN